MVKAQGGEERAKCGDNLIKEYSLKLSKELGKGYSISSLKYMRQFYILKKSQPVVDQISWTHYTILLSLKNKEVINYYIKQIISRNLSKRELQRIIKNKEYER